MVVKHKEYIDKTDFLPLTTYTQLPDIPTSCNKKRCVLKAHQVEKIKSVTFSRDFDPFTDGAGASVGVKSSRENVLTFRQIENELKNTRSILNTPEAGTPEKT